MPYSNQNITEQLVVDELAGAVQQAPPVDIAIAAVEGPVEQVPEVAADLLNDIAVDAAGDPGEQVPAVAADLLNDIAVALAGDPVEPAGEAVPPPPAERPARVIRGKWAQRGVPKKRWTCNDVVDHGNDMQVCEMCEEQQIRFAHVMSHPEYDGQLHVGCVCAGNMSEDLGGARRREATVKNRAAKRRRWTRRRRWRVAENGERTLKAYGYITRVFPRDGGWGCEVNPVGGARIEILPGVFDTLESAQLAGFDHITATGVQQ